MNYKLGKLPAKFDKRTIQFKSIRKALPPSPPEWDVDAHFPFPIPLHMFGNDQYGDCVIAGRANLTLRFEAAEQKKVILIKDKDVTDQYFAESGGADNGLVMLDSLNAWRQKGWRIGARKLACIKYGGQFYDIHAFAQIDHKDLEDVRASIWLLSGCYAGIQVPLSCLDQFDAGEIWEDVGDTNIAGGHCITICQYDEIGPTCLTWMRKQLMTWKFWNRYCDEAYAIVDNLDNFIDNSPIDVEQLESFLDDITE